ncbi:host attachment family protein [Sphingomonas sp.]|uniref:host attachment family protein n=1 Tax=Sphingomonas sp. TaxID=28214 RepID=UPI003B00BC6B
MQVPHDTYVLVADGRKLLFLRNDGDAQALDLKVERAEEQSNPATRDQATDAAGRASSTGGGGRHGHSGSSVEPTDFHQLEEDRFAADAAEMLKKRALANGFERLIIVAPPKTLGELRKHYHKEVEARLTGELAKDLTGHTIPDIEKALLAAD